MAKKQKHQKPRSGSITPTNDVAFAASLDGRLQQAKKERRRQRTCLPVFNLLALLLLFLSSSSGFALPFLEVNFNLRIDGDLVPRALMFAASGLGVLYVLIHVIGSRTHFTITQHGPPWLYGNHLHTAALLITRLTVAVWVTAIVMISLLVARLGLRLGAPLAVQSVYLDLIVSAVAFLSLIAVIICIEMSKTPFKTSVLSRRSFLNNRQEPERSKTEDSEELSVSRRASLIKAEKRATLVVHPKKKRKMFGRNKPDDDDQPRELLQDDDEDEYDFVSGSSDRPLRSPVRSMIIPPEEQAVPPSFMTSRNRQTMPARPASAPRAIMPPPQPEFIINPQTGRPVTYFDVRREPTLPVLMSPARPVTYFDVPKRPATSYMPHRPKSTFETASTFDTSSRPTTSFDPLAEPMEKFEPTKKIERPTSSRQPPRPTSSREPQRPTSTWAPPTIPTRTPSAADRPRPPPPVTMTRYTLMPPPQRPMSAGLIKRKPVSSVQSRMSTGSAQQVTPEVAPPAIPYRGFKNPLEMNPSNDHTATVIVSDARPPAPGFLNLVERAKARQAARSRSGSRSGSDGAGVGQRDGPVAPMPRQPPSQQAPAPVQNFKTIPPPAWAQRPQSTAQRAMSVSNRGPSPQRNTASPFQDPGNPFQDPSSSNQSRAPSRSASRGSVVSALTSTSRPTTERTISTRTATTAPTTVATTPSISPPPALKSRSPSPKSSSRSASTSRVTHSRGLSRTQLRMRKEGMARAVHHRAASSVNNFSRPLRAQDSAESMNEHNTHARTRSDAAESATSGSGGSMAAQRGDTPPPVEIGSGSGRVRGSRIEKRSSRVVSAVDRRSGPMSPMTIMMLREQLR